MTEKDFDPKAIKALALDLDGTLLRPDKTISERSLRALRACMENGIKIILATGRACSSTEKYRKQINTNGPHIYFNGAKVVDISAEKEIYTRYVDAEPVRFCVNMARQMNIFFQVYFQDNNSEIVRNSGETFGEVLIADKKTAEAEKYEQSTGVKVMTGDLEEYLAASKAVIKAMFITPEENHQNIRRLLREQFGQSVYIVQSTPIFLEILAEGVSKGSGLEHALRYLGIGKENTIAFGDEENDLPMLKIAGFSAAPANAKEVVRKTALFQIPADSEDGVAIFLEEWFGI